MRMSLEDTILDVLLIWLKPKRNLFCLTGGVASSAVIAVSSSDLVIIPVRHRKMMQKKQ
jgi:hypothetical protein